MVPQHTVETRKAGDAKRLPDYRVDLSDEVSLKTLDDQLLPAIQRREVTRYVIDLSNLRFTKVTGAVNMLLLLGYLSRRADKRCVLIPPSSREVTSFLCNMRFFVLAENMCHVEKRHPLPEPDSLSSRTQVNVLEIKSILARETDEGFFNKLGKSVQNTVIDRLSNIAHGHFAFLSGVYLELCKNIFEHSRSFGFVAAQAHSGLFQITIGDLGIGIYNSLQSFYDRDRARFERRYGPVWDEAKALDIAFAVGVSRKEQTADKEAAGAGLWTVLRAARQSKGAVICRSGTHKVFIGYRQDKWTTQRKAGLVPFPGTQLELYVRLDGK